MKSLWSVLVLAVVFLAGLSVGAQPPPPTQAPPVPGPDLEVVSVKINTPLPAWFEGIARNSTVDVTVRNRGDVDVASYQLIFRWVVGSGVAPLNGNLSNSFDAVETPLRAGQQSNYRFHWRLQTAQAGLGTVLVTAQVASGGGVGGGGGAGDTNPNNNARGTDVFVVRHALQWDAENTPRALRPDEATFIRFTLRNFGNVDETVSLALATSQGQGVSRLKTQLAASQITVPAFGTAKGTLFIDFPFDYDSAPIAARFTVRATSSYGRVLEALTPTVTNSERLMNLQAYAAQLTGPTETVYAPKDSTTVVEWAAKNMGQEIDTYTIVADAGPGWTTLVHPARVGLNPGEVTNVRVEVMPGPGLEGGSGTDLVLRFKSEHPVPEVNATRPLRVSGPAPQILGLQPATRIYKGDSPPLQVRWFNGGDMALPSGTLAVTARMADGSAVAAGQPVSALAPGQEGRVDVRVGPLNAPGEIQYEVRWQGAGPPPSSNATALAWVHDPRIEVFAPAALNGTPGEGVSYTVPPYVFQVRNNGATAENLTLVAFSSPGSAQILGPSRITLTPGEQRTVAMRQILPRASTGNAVPLELKATVENRPDFEWKAAVHTPSLDWRAPVVTVISRPADWDLTTPMPIVATATDDGVVASVQAMVIPPSGPNRTIALVVGIDTMWRGQIQFAADGNHTLRVASTDTVGNTATIQSWRVVVHPAPVPRIDVALPSSGEWQVDRPLNITVAGVSNSTIGYALEQGGSVRSEGTLDLIDGKAALPLQGVGAGSAILKIQAIGMQGETVETAFGLTLVEDRSGSSSTTSFSGTLTQRPTPLLGLGWSVGAAVALLVWARRRCL